MKIYKFISWATLYIVPVLIVWFYFKERQPAKVTVGVGGVFLGAILLIKYYGKFKGWVAKKEMAHEVARNLGQQSRTVNFHVIEALNFIFLAAPFLLILGIIEVAKNYNGRMEMPILYILASFTVSGLFKIAYRAAEQAEIAANNLAALDAQNETIAEKMAAKLKL